uniref:Uncharacterized protein n=1 Tax=Janibacter limosus TaxID=53458 RepID=A0AC61U7Q8_9MICO|nr:hypothetical protein [Janibacter limosus]
MRNVWVISGIRRGWMPVFEYYAAQAEAVARVEELVADEQRDFEELGARVASASRGSSTARSGTCRPTPSTSSRTSTPSMGRTTASSRAGRCPRSASG